MSRAIDGAILIGAACLTLVLWSANERADRRIAQEFMSFHPPAFEPPTVRAHIPQFMKGRQAAPPVEPSLRIEDRHTVSTASIERVFDVHIATQSGIFVEDGSPTIADHPEATHTAEPDTPDPR